MLKKEFISTAVIGVHRVAGNLLLCIDDDGDDDDDDEDDDDDDGHRVAGHLLLCMPLHFPLQQQKPK